MKSNTTEPLSILVLGASYGMLIAIKALLAGHRVLLVGRTDEVEVIQRNGFYVEFPGSSDGAPLSLASSSLRGELLACSPEAVDPAAHDLVLLAMQEPHYAAPEIQVLMNQIAYSRRPCLSFMNMAPLPYLKRIPALATMHLNACYTAPECWSTLAPGQLTLCSPDPQAARPLGRGLNILKVGLATNFRAATFSTASDTALLRRFASSTNDARVLREGRRSPLPVRLRLHDSPFVPLSKWSMLLAGNYRCIEKDGIRPICRAVLDDTAQSREVYDFVNEVLRELGAAEADLVSFDHYASVAQHLVHPSSAARALLAGVTAIERVDRLVQAVARQLGSDSGLIDRIVDQVDRRLAMNKQAA